MKPRRTLPLALRTLDDERVRGLSNSAFRVFIYLHLQLVRGGNGELTFTRRDACDAGLNSERARQAAVHELLAADLVRCAEAGTGPGRPSRYSLTTSPGYVPALNRSHRGSGTAPTAGAVAAPRTVAVRPQDGSGSDELDIKHARGRAHASISKNRTTSTATVLEGAEQVPLAAGASVHFLAGRRS